MENYLNLQDMTAEHIPGIRRGYATGCYRGYVGVWLIENDRFYLTQIRDYTGRSTASKADLEALFGEKYQDGKVLAATKAGSSARA